MYRIADTSTGASQLRLFEDPLQAFRQRLQRDLAALAVSGVELLAAWVAVVAAEVQARFAANERTAQKAVAETARLFRFLIARGAETWSAVTAELVLGGAPEPLGPPPPHQAVHSSKPAVGRASGIRGGGVSGRAHRSQGARRRADPASFKVCVGATPQRLRGPSSP